jgi:hypothetical protein
MRIPGSGEFFVFVTSGAGGSTVTGESWFVTGGDEQPCAWIEVHLLNCLIPGTTIEWRMRELRLVMTRSECSYDLTRLSLPAHEINLTHTLRIAREDGQPISWAEVSSHVDRFLEFVSFANCSRVSAPIVYGYSGDGAIRCFQFRVPQRSLPTNRRTWATNLDEKALSDALSLFLKTSEGPFWSNILDRAIEWQILTENAAYESEEQALFTVQMLLEMLSYVVLVEDSQVLGEDGYGKLPASDRITLLCGHTHQRITIDLPWREEFTSFCTANSLRNVGELITALRNKLIHPTKKNREYLDRVPPRLRSAAISLGTQIASLVLLKTIGYKGAYFDILHHDMRQVPWQ